MGRNEVAIVLRKVNNGWKESGYFPGNRAPSLRPDTWIVAVLEEGIAHYSWDEWVPKVDALKEGTLVEATISWKDIAQQLAKQRHHEQKRFNDRVRQFYLEKYGERVLFEWRDSQDAPIPEEVFRRFFFRRRSDEAAESKDNVASELMEQNTERLFEKDQIEGTSGDKESFVVSWEEEGGGLMGNQVVDSTSAQISLLPGTVYLARIASNEGPGSFAIEIDTRILSVEIWKANHFVEIYIVYILAVAAAIIAFCAVVFIVNVQKKQSKKIIALTNAV